MTINELSQLDELRVALRAIGARLSLLQIHLDSLRGKIDDAYYAACSDFNEDGNLNKEAKARLQEVETKCNLLRKKWN